MVTVPVIHSNGTSAERLIADLGEAYSRIRSALQALGKTEPNGRDYCLRPGSFEVAVAEHKSRCERLLSVKTELEELIGSIYEMSHA